MYLEGVNGVRSIACRQRPVRPYPEKDRKRQETPKKTRKRPKKTLFSTEFYIIWYYIPFDITVYA